jgi:adenosyl cobinamide kinase/adenosyl cobinamide phosphate guanylyltransferase
MSLLVLVGGARSGKSRLALSLARARPEPVVFVATAEFLDPEMEERVQRHRAERPSRWTTVEAPYELEAAVGAAPGRATVIVDCLTLWLSNLLCRGDDPGKILAAAERVAAVSAARAGLTICVTNEVGLGVVPATPLGRAFRDLQGSANRLLVDAADRAALVVAGRALPLDDATTLLARLG